MGDKRRYISAFNGARDFYQVPIALEEVGQLENFVTDLLFPNCLSTLETFPMLKKRSLHNIPFLKVCLSLRALLFQCHPSRKPDYFEVDRCIGRLAAQVSERKRNAGLFIYSGYALEAFRNARAGQVKILFYYHPHSKLSREILQHDALMYPEFGDFEMTDKDFADGRMQTRRDAEIHLADFLVCASSFTKRSLIHMGVDPARISVVPYGIEPGVKLVPQKREKRFLFVGQGVQRKGLHHLINAWDKAKLNNARLDIVCYQIDPRMPVPKSGNVHVHSYLAKGALDLLFLQSSVFVMPSLIEGFGLVYLEALSAGCLCIGTNNTGLPDLRLGKGKITISAGDEGALESALRMADTEYDEGIPHSEISAQARIFSWQRFRRGLIDALDNFEAATKLTQVS